jgi:PhzF family phenazine biosynthesis protein
MKQKYTLIDAFTKTPFAGAQIAVFTHADKLNEQQKQLLAKELNLTESVFITRSLDERYDAQLEILTPRGDSGFAGHAVVAAGYALGDVGIVKSSDARILVNGNEINITLSVKNQKVQINIPVTEKYDEYVPSNSELSQVLWLDEKDIGYNKYKPMLTGCPDSYLIVPVKNIQALRKAKFNENKWQLSFVASLAKQVLLFTGDHPFEDVNFAARIVGKQISETEDPPIGAAAPSFGLYLSYGKNDYHRSSLVQRGDESSRVSILEVTVDKKGAKVMGLQLGGHAVKVGEGYFDLAD